MKHTHRSLRAYLDATGQTQAELAEDLGITSAHLSMLLAGIRKPSVDLALRIEKHTGVSVRDQVEGSAA